MPIQAWFPTFIYEAPLDGKAALNRLLLDDCRKIRDHDAEGRAWCREHYPGGYTSYSTLHRLHRMFSTFTELEQRLDRHVKAFTRRLDLDLEGSRLEMTDCWVNLMPRHAIHGLHLHTLSVVSGTYYVQAPGGSSPLRFEDPRLSRLMGSPPRRADCRPENRQHVRYGVKAGNVVLFESWLRHEVGPNRTDRERVSVSFNYGWFSGRKRAGSGGAAPAPPSAAR